MSQVSSYMMIGLFYIPCVKLYDNRTILCPRCQVVKLYDNMTILYPR